MSQVRYPHRATKRLDDLDPLNGPRLHDRIYSDILVAGLDFRRDRADEFRPNTELLASLMDISQDYTDEAGPFSDLFGEWLECNGETSERNGQFFTPIDVVDMMVEMTFQGIDLDRRPVDRLRPGSGTGPVHAPVYAKHFGERTGSFNFLMTNIDIDRRAFTFCTIMPSSTDPAIHIHGDTLRMEVYDAFATLPSDGSPSGNASGRDRPGPHRPVLKPPAERKAGARPSRRRPCRPPLPGR